MNKKKLYNKYITHHKDGQDPRMSEELEIFGIEDDEKESLEDYEGTLEEDLSDKLFTKVQYGISESRRHKRRKGLRILGVVLVFGFLFGLTQYNKLKDNRLIPTAFKEARTTVVNHADSIAIVDLPDHSILRLYPHSSVYYFENYNVNQRNIYLQGEAVFQVQKDKRKPFNVYSGNIVTTAIGTKFKVLVDKKNIFVKLIEGKIVVNKAADLSDAHYLTAGNSIYYNIRQKTFTSVLHTAHITGRKSVEKQQIEQKTTPETILTLDNTPLNDALDQIAENYNVEIEYSPQDIDNINIIARIDPTKSVYNVLHMIALMNNLQVLTIDDRQFILQKAK